jgi:hypothetical protein
MNVGDRVQVNGRDGEIVSIQPGNGTIKWYFVQFSDGTEDRFMEREIDYSTSRFSL